jgi:hypothetical protein
VVAPKLYGLRQSAATNAADDGVSSRAIADAMGHADVATTEQYDRRTFESVQEAALAQVAGAIRQERGGGAWRLECRWNAERPSEDRGSADGSRDELPGMQGRENGRRGQIWTGDP